MTEWLVRTAKNQIMGPFSKEKVCELIRDSEIGPEDEVCPANGYWIFIHEREEVLKLLGVEVPKTVGGPGLHEEITETETERISRAEYPELDGVAGDDEQTAMLGGRAFRQFCSKKGNASASANQTQVIAVRRAAQEPQLFVRLVAWLMVIGAAFVVFAVLHRIRTH